MAGDKSGRVIFIGNIPYGLTEEQIVHIFSNVGQVLSFRLVYDKDTGRPKGFGFAEFSDADSAASAVRNLNDHEVMGRRLRVDYSNDGGAGDSAPSNQTSQTHQQQQHQPNGVPPSSLPPLPTGADLPQSLTCPDAISRTLSTLQPPQLIDIISQMKGLVMSDPAKANQLLTAAPQLAYAIFQSLLLLGLVDTSALQSVVDQNAGPPQQLQQPQQHQQPPPPPPAQQQAQYPFGLVGGGGMGGGIGHVPTPPQNQGYQPPPPPPPPHVAQLQQQVLALTQQQLDAMPPVERAQLLAIRQQILAGTFPTG